MQDRSYEIILARDCRQVAKVAKLQVDYVFPGYTELEDETFYRLNDQLKKSFGRTLRAKLKSAA